MESTLNFQSVTKSFSLETRLPLPWNPFGRAASETRTVIEPFSLSLKPGEKVILCGKNGIGKTTLLKLAAGLIRPDSGKIEAHGSVGIMLTHYLLYNLLTGRQNLQYSAHLFNCTEVEERVEEETRNWDLSEFVERKVLHYSNGQKTLLALARANIHRPSLLLLDEPLVFLDTKHRDRLFHFLKTTSQTILMTAQEPETLRPYADRTVPL